MTDQCDTPYNEDQDAFLAWVLHQVEDITHAAHDSGPTNEEEHGD
jgi:hypothetical protein